MPIISNNETAFIAIEPAEEAAARLVAAISTPPITVALLATWVVF